MAFAEYASLDVRNEDVAGARHHVLRDVSGHRLGWPSGHDPLEHNAIGHVLMRPTCDGVLIGRVSCRVDDLKSHGTLSSGRIAVTAGARRERIFARPNARATIVMGVRRCDMLARGARSIPPGSIGADPRAVGSTESFDMALAQVVYAHGRYHSPGSGLPCFGSTRLFDRPAQPRFERVCRVVNGPCRGA